MHVDLATIEQDAEQALDEGSYAYAAGGSDEERTLRDNEASWRAVRLRPRVLRAVEPVDTATTVLGRPHLAPILIPPMAMQKLFWPDGEIEMARAAAMTGTVLVVSLASTTGVDEIARAVPDARLWFHLTMLKHRGQARDLCARARDAGCEAIVLTVDCPVPARRPRSEQTPFVLPPDVTFPHLGSVDDPLGLLGLVDGFDRRTTFDDLALVAEWSGLPVVVKGVLRGDDARRCVDAGAAAVIVSNHGGRSLDQCVSTGRALPDVVEQLDGRGEVLVDGGLRRGNHVAAALAMGARATLVGRPVLYGLAVAGAAGASGVVDELVVELARTMALCGAACVDDLRDDLIADRPAKAGRDHTP